MNRFLSLLLTVSVIFLVSCKDDDTSQPIDERTNSEVTGDVMATTIGQETGGAGIIAQDAANLAEGFSFSNSVFTKGGVVTSLDSTYDPATKTHTVILVRNKTFGLFSYNATMRYHYIFYTGPLATASFTKGVTDKIMLSVNGRNQILTPRINSDDSSHGDFVVTGMAIGGAQPTMNGSYWRGGTNVLTKALQGKSVTTDQMINFINCLLNRTSDTTVSMTGTATATYNATGSEGHTATRNIVAVFNGDGTATLAMTRINQGVTDSCMVDVKTGKWLKWITTK